MDCCAARIDGCFAPFRCLTDRCCLRTQLACLKENKCAEPGCLAIHGAFDVQQAARFAVTASSRNAVRAPSSDIHTHTGHPSVLIGRLMFWFCGVLCRGSCRRCAPSHCTAKVVAKWLSGASFDTLRPAPSTCRGCEMSTSSLCLARDPSTAPHRSLHPVNMQLHRTLWHRHFTEADFYRLLRHAAACSVTSRFWPRSRSSFARTSIQSLLAVRTFLCIVAMRCVRVRCVVLYVVA